MTRTVVIFDLDGTLVDSADTVVETAASAYAAHDLQPPDRAAIRAGIGTPLVDVLARGGAPTSYLQRLADTYRALYRPTAARLERPFQGAVELVKDLHQRGLRLGVATGKGQRGAERSTTAHGFRPFLGAVAGMDGHRRGKPHPDILHAALEGLGATADDAIMVGDTTFDLDMARHAGVPAIGVAWGVHPVSTLRQAASHGVTHSITELATALRALV